MTFPSAPLSDRVRDQYFRPLFSALSAVNAGVLVVENRTSTAFSGLTEAFNGFLATDDESYSSIDVFCDCGNLRERWWR